MSSVLGIIVGGITSLLLLALVIFGLYWLLKDKRNVPVGERCDSDGDCINDACGRPSAADGTKKVCCASGKTTTYAAFDYCTEMPNDTVCWSGDMCAGGVCRDNAGGFTRGFCAGNGTVNQRCGVDADCQNGACGRLTAADGATPVCCPSGDTTRYAGFDYCTNMPNGSVCWSDAMCGSGNCKGNSLGLQKGVCSS